MTKVDNKTLFSEFSPARLFFTAAIPGSVGMLFSSVYQLMDGIMVGRVLGDTAFAAVNLAMPFVIINFALADLIGVGSSVPIAHALGRKDDKEANNIFTCACIAIVVAGIIVGAALFALARPLMRLMGAEGVLVDYAARYLEVYALLSPVTTVIFAVDNYLRISGVIRGSLFINILMSLLSMGLEFLFLFVFEWGILGAALGTGLGMSIAAIVAFVPFFMKKLPLRFVRPHFTKSVIKTTISCGMPNFLNNIAARVASVFMNVLLLRFGGETAVSVYGVLMYVDGFILPLMYGTCDSLQPAIGFNWGAGDYKRAFRIEKYCFIACAVVSVASAAVLFAAPDGISHIFLGEGSPEIIETARVAIRIFAFTYLARWVSFAAQSFFLAIGRPLPAGTLSLSISLVVPLLLIPCFYSLELTGLWLNTPVAAVVVAVIAVILLVIFFHKFKTSDPQKFSLNNHISPPETGISETENTEN